MCSCLSHRCLCHTPTVAPAVARAAAPFTTQPSYISSTVRKIREQAFGCGRCKLALRSMLTATATAATVFRRLRCAPETSVL